MPARSEGRSLLGGPPVIALRAWLPWLLCLALAACLGLHGVRALVLYSTSIPRPAVRLRGGRLLDLVPPPAPPIWGRPLVTSVAPHHPSKQFASAGDTATNPPASPPLPVLWIPGCPGADETFEQELKEIERLKRRKEPRHKVLPTSSAFLDTLLVQINAQAEKDGAVQVVPEDKAPQAPSHLSDAFAVYLTAFLINFDPEFTRWWTKEIKYQMPHSIRPKYRASRLVREVLVRRDFQELARQLQRKCNLVPVEQLAQILVTFYKHRKSSSPESRQLALLLAMLPPEGQRVADDAIRFVWKGDPVGQRSPRQALLTENSTVVMLRGAGYYGPKMMSRSHRPVYDEAARQWVVTDPGMQPKPQRHPFSPGDMQAELPTVPPSFWWGIVLLGLSGAISCMLTNAVVLPLDVLKTAQQTSDVSLGLGESVRQILAQRGWVGFFYGFGAMMMNELCTGLFMYPGVELGKVWLGGKLGSSLAKTYRVLIVVAATTMATVVSCLAQSPWESAKIRIQSVPGYAKNCFGVVHRMVAEHGVGFLYTGYVPLLCRMVFYNSAKFIVFDGFADLVSRLFPMLGGRFRGAMTLLKGFIAGVAATFVSQPADAVLTRMTQSDEYPHLWAAAVSLWETKGLEGFFRGFILRALWSASKIALQFFCYERIKMSFYDAVLFGVN